jgi:hypothetical protein
MVAAKNMPAVGTDLAMMIDGSGGIRSRLRTTLRDDRSRARLKVGDEVRVEGAGTLGQHG